MRRIGTTSGGTHIVEFTESDLDYLLKTVEGLRAAVALPAVLSPAPVTDEAETPGDVPRRTEPPRARVAGKAKKASAPVGERRCIICKAPLSAEAKRSHVTCGSAPCKKQHQSDLARKWYLKRKAEGKAAGKATPAAGREATPAPAREALPAPAVDKESRRELIRRLALKKGMEGTGEAKGARDSAYVQPED